MYYFTGSAPMLNPRDQGRKAVAMNALSHSRNLLGSPIVSETEDQACPNRSRTNEQKYLSLGFIYLIVFIFENKNNAKLYPQK